MALQPSHSKPSRCRIVLTLGLHETAILADFDPSSFASTFSAGDVASLIFYGKISDPNAYQSQLGKIIPQAQSLDIACLVADNSQIAGRVGADGLHLGQDHNLIRDAIDKFSPSMMVGAGNVKTRHNALTIGELQPDYVMFGAVGGDTRDDPHPKNLALGDWWSSLVELPCIVLGGRAIESVLPVAATGAEFVALGSAIFPPDNDENLTADGMEERIRHANDLLDRNAPSFEDHDT